MTGDRIRPLHVPPIATADDAAQRLDAQLHLIPRMHWGAWDQQCARALAEDADPAVPATVADWLRRVYVVGHADGQGTCRDDLRTEQEYVRRLAGAIRAAEHAADLARMHDVDDPAGALRDLLRRLDAALSGQVQR